MTIGVSDDLDLVHRIRQEIQNVSGSLQPRLQESGIISNRSIHQLRLDIKHLRAWLRLIKPMIKDVTGYQKFDNSLRQISRDFARQRDAHVLYQTLNRLYARVDKPGKKDLILRVRTELQQNILPETDNLQVVRLKEISCDFLQYEHLSKNRNELVFLQLIKNFRRLRHQRHHAVGPEATPSRRHRFRKRLKYLYYQLRLLEQDVQLMSDNDLKRMNQLGQWLGRVNDLHNLDSMLERSAKDQISPKEYKNIRKIIEQEEHRLLEKARCLFDKVFDVEILNPIN